MTFDEYEKSGREQYQRLSEVISRIIAVSLENRGLSYQQLQHRAKALPSLNQKLVDRSVDTQDDITAAVKDLAGCRILFYTNNDVSDFRHSGIIGANFEVDRERTKFHYPLAEGDADQLFISYNYVVRLKEPRLSLPEYAGLEGMWCEVQVQTTLDHAWSEMAHDTLYKPKAVAGFGTRQQNGIRERMTALMEKRLIPAGHDFQKIADDARRLEKAQEIFQSDPLATIRSATTNEERSTALQELTDYALPYYDDLPDVAADILQCMFEVASAALPGGEIADGQREGMPQFLAGLVLDRAFSVVRSIHLSVVDETLLESTFDALCRLHHESKTGSQRQKVLEAAEYLSKYELRIWQRAGPYVQQILLSSIQRMDDADKVRARPVLVEALRKMLEPEVTGSTWGFDTVTLETGQVIATDAVIKLRSEVISCVEDLLDSTDNDGDRRAAISALMASTRISHRGNTVPTILTMVLVDAARVVRLIADRFPSFSFELRADVEHDLQMLAYHRTRLPDDYERDNVLNDAVGDLTNAIQEFRDATKAVEDYGEYLWFKTLVGYNHILDHHWDNDPFDRDFRDEEVARLAASIDEENIQGWTKTIVTCAQTVSSDGATFIYFQKFLQKFGELQPALAKKVLEGDDARLVRFLPWLMIGIEENGPSEEVKSLIETWIAGAINAQAVACYIRYSKTDLADKMTRAAYAAMVTGDDWALTLLITDPRVAKSRDLVRDVLVPHARFLSGRRDYHWIERFRFETQQAPLTDVLDEDQARELLEIIKDAPKVTYSVEVLLAAITQHWPSLVVEFFEHRISRENADERDEDYEALPFDMHYLPERAAPLRAPAIQTAKRLFDNDKEGFRYRGGKLAALLAPEVSDIEPTLSAYLNTGQDADIEFVLDLLSAYSDGESSTSTLCKEAVAALDPASDLLGDVKAVIENSGVLSGEFGRVDFLKSKRGCVLNWLADPRDKVQRFATSYIAELDRDIAAEQRRATEEYQLRRRTYGKD